MNIALITARGGSKGLPRKNILPLQGKPLIAWTIEAAMASKSNDMVYVSTEDSEIANISREYGAKVIPRPLYLSEDATSSEPVIAHAIEYLKMNKIDVTNVCLLQPTSPLRNSNHIDSAFNLFELMNANCVLSVFEPKHSASKAYKIKEDGSITGLLFEHAPYCRRQDLPATYQPNGAIYLFSAIEFMFHERIPREKVYPFIMTENESVDIDTIDDLRDVEIMINSEKNND